MFYATAFLSLGGVIALISSVYRFSLQGCPDCAQYAPRSHRDNIYDRLNWLTVNQLVVYHTLVSVHRIRQTEQPEYLADILCKTSRQVRGGIIVENNKLGLARKSFTIRGAEQWNKLTSSLRMEQKLSKFKQGLRNWIADNVPRFLP